MTKRMQVRPLAAEGLENRTMMAGDIAASVQGGILYLRGDDAANGVQVRQSGGNLEVVGVAAGGQATTINGGASFLATGVTRGLTAVLGDGNDIVRLHNETTPVRLPGAVVVNTGAGHDSVAGRIVNSGAVTLALGEGNDSAALGGSSLGTLVVNTDPFTTAGADQVRVSNSRVARGAAIRTGGGNDSVLINGNSAFPGTLSVSVDDGNDRVQIQGTAAAPIAVGAAFTVNTGRGNDVVDVQRLNVNGAATISNFDGNARVKLDYVRAVDGLFAYLGAGDDALAVTNSTARRAVFFGGLGVDTLLSQDNTFGEVVRVSF